MKIRIWTVVAIGLFGVAAYFGVTRIGALRAHDRAQAAIQAQDWRSARTELQTYLGVFPADESARLKLAEAFFKDARLDPERAVSSAILQLNLVRRESALWPAARLQEARMTLFARLQPHRAEALLRETLANETDNVEAHYVIWKLFDLTGRSHLAEPYFRKVLDATPSEQRPFRLREWYMSQFYPATANPELDQMMGFHNAGAARSSLTELRRLEAFRDLEQKAAPNHAAVARWFSLEGDPKLALKMLQDALEIAEAPLQDPFFVATLVQVLFDLGEFESALKYFRAWPGERSGYEYSRLGAILGDDVERDYENAISRYRQVISVWPGQADWRIQFRLARCLAKSGNEEAAETMRQKAKQIELLMEEDIHVPLRRLLATPDQLEICHQMTQFYEQLGLEFETQQWREQFTRLQKKGDRSGRSGTP